MIQIFSIIKLYDLNSDIKTCFLLSSQISKLESAILNSRLRSKFLNETFNIVTLWVKSKIIIFHLKLSI